MNPSYQKAARIPIVRNARVTVARTLLLQPHGDWRVIQGKRLEREYRFRSFRGALAFVWGYLRVSLFTRAIAGLHENALSPWLPALAWLPHSLFSVVALGSQTRELLPRSRVTWAPRVLPR